MRAVSCTILLSLAFASIASVAHSQSPSVQSSSTVKTEAPAYDVMTIKPNKSGSGGTSYDGHGASFNAQNLSLKMLLQYTYDLNEDSIVGIPSQLDAKRFDIDAKIVEPDLDALKKLSGKQGRLMLLPLLTERFQLKTHMETRPGSIYELVVAKGGSTLKPSEDQTSRADGSLGTSSNGRSSKITAKCMPIASLAKVLADQLHRPVVDKTALAGNYDLTLQWSLDDAPVSTDADSAPSIYTAVQEQLGLKLQPAKGPVEVLVVDHAALPSDN
jgi:uncharacterized protein (TIGR03435 family)